MRIFEKTVAQKAAIGVIGVLHLLVVQSFIFGKVLHPQIGWLLIGIALTHVCVVASIIWRAHAPKTSFTVEESRWWWKVAFWWYAPSVILIAFAAGQQHRFVTFVTMIAALLYVIMSVHEYFFALQKNIEQTPQSKHTVVKPQKFLLALVVGGIILGAALRAYFIFNGKLDGDEGNYLYDALQILRGYIPYVNYNIRAVSYIGFLAAWLKIIGIHTMAVARSSHLILFLVTSSALYVSLRRLWNQRAAVAGTLLYALSPFAAFTGMVLKTEPFQEMMHSLVLLFCVLVWKSKKKWAVPVLLIAALTDIATRPSSLIFIACVAVYLTVHWLKHHKPHLFETRYLPVIVSSGIAAVVAIALILTAQISYFGRLFSVLKYAKNMNFTRFARQVDITIRNMTDLFGSVLMIELFAVISLACIVLVLLHRSARVRRVLWSGIAVWLGLAVYYLLKFITAGKQSPVLVLILVSVVVGSAVLIAFTAEKDRLYHSISDEDRAPLIGVAAYTIVLLFFYMLFKRFEVSYVVEFLLPLHILAGYGVSLLWRTTKTRNLVIVLVSVSALLALSVFTGSTQNAKLIQDNHYRHHSLAVIEQTTVAIRQYVPEGQEIFSGNTVFAADSGYRLAKDIAHPQFDYHDFPSAEKQNKLLEYLIDHNVRYVIEDYKMQYFYYLRNPLIQDFVAKNFHTVYYDVQNHIRLLEKNS